LPPHSNRTPPRPQASPPFILTPLPLHGSPTPPPAASTCPSGDGANVAFPMSPLWKGVMVMSDLEILTMGGDSVTVRHSAVDDLRAALHGELLLPGDAGYDGARAVWNGLIDRRPAMTARCSRSADVLMTVCFAREREPLVSVRCTPTLPSSSRDRAASTRLLPRHLRPAGGDQAPVRPGQLFPTEPQHPAGRGMIWPLALGCRWLAMAYRPLTPPSSSAMMCLCRER